MERTLLIWLGMLFAFAGNIHADDKLYIEDFTIEKGETKTVEVLLDNPNVEYRDIQFNLYLPDGISVATDEEDELMYELGSRCTDDHVLVLAESGDHYVGMLYSSAANPLSGNSGAVLKLTLKADENANVGKVKGYFRNVSLSKKNATGPTYEEFAFNITIPGEGGQLDPEDPVQEERLYMEDFTINQGETKTISVLLDNPDAAYRDVQFDLYLPTGVSVAKDSEDEFIYELGSRCTSDHVLVLAESGNHYVGMLYSSGAAPLNGNSGVIINLTLKAEENARVGKMKGYFRNVSLSKKNATGPTYEEFSFSITVKGEPIAWKLDEGWNWVSHNLAGNLNPTEVFGENVIEVKSQTKGLVRDSQYGMVGNLKELVATEGYKVKTSAADTEPHLLIGDLFDAEANAINLKEGWNWIGYPMANEESVEDALKGFDPMEGDCIVGLDDFSTYTGSSWDGSLTVLTPGKGYMYKSGETKSVHFSKASSEAKAREAKARKDSEDSQWTCDIHKYPNRMPAIVCLYIKDVEANVSDYDVAAFCGDECRGVGKVVKGVVMMNVCGEGDETITFKAIDKKSGIVMDINESVTFTGDVLGAYTEPFRLTLGEENITDIAIIPSSTGIEEIVYNAAGQHVTKDKQALPKGVYIHMKNGKATKVFVK